ncbi:UNVERIFIED_CONTAM: hypothetical protein K2H54_037056 [Gekko kuhli]
MDRASQELQGARCPLKTVRQGPALDLSQAQLVFERLPCRDGEVRFLRGPVSGTTEPGQLCLSVVPQRTNMATPATCDPAGPTGFLPAEQPAESVNGFPERARTCPHRSFLKGPGKG